MKTRTPGPRNTHPPYTVSPCYRLVLQERTDSAPTPREDRRLDTPRGSAVRRPALPW